MNFVPKPSHVLSEMIRAVRIGGTVAAYAWDYADQMQLIRYFWNAAIELDITAQGLDEGQRFLLCRSESLRQLFKGNAKLEKVDVHPIDIDTIFRNFDDYWLPFMGGQGPAPNYVMSLSEKEKVALREHIRLTLPLASDGSIHLIARAWAVRGVRRN